MHQARDCLLTSQEGLPLVFLTPKQATFQIERLLLEANGLEGFTRLQIVSFDRLATFLLSYRQEGVDDILSEDGKLMILRGLVIKHRDRLEAFHKMAGQVGFATHLKSLFRELHQHGIGPLQLSKLAQQEDLPIATRRKLGDLSFLLSAYHDWLCHHHLEDSDRLLEIATATIRQDPSLLRIEALWLDGFAEMTPTEIDFLVALLPCVNSSTLAFCLDQFPSSSLSWLSRWASVSGTFLRLFDQVASLLNHRPKVEILPRHAHQSRFASQPMLAALERGWNEDVPEEGHNDSAHSDDAIRVLRCPSQDREAEQAAQTIKRAIEQGIRFRECAIFVRDLGPYLPMIRRCLASSGIPYYVDQRESISHHPLIVFVLSTIRLIAFRWQTEDWIRILKTGLVRVEESWIWQIENTAINYGWNGEDWLKPIDANPSLKNASALEVGRQQSTTAFLHHYRSLTTKAGAATALPIEAATLVSTFRALFDQLKVQETLNEWTQAKTRQASTSIQHQQVWERLESWLDNVEKEFSDEALEPSEWLSIFETSLKQLTVGVVPQTLDQVLVGAIDRTRSPRIKVAIVMGLNDQVFPGPIQRPVILTESDRQLLSQHQIGGRLSSRIALSRETFLAYIALTRASEQLLLTFSETAPDGRTLERSPILDHVFRLFPRLKETSCPETMLRALETPAPHIETVAANLSKDAIGRLLGNNLKTSVSALEEFAACPFHYFASRTLRLKPTETYEIEPRHRGTLQHELLRLFHSEVQEAGLHWRDLNPSKAQALIFRLSEGLIEHVERKLFATDASSRISAVMLTENVADLVSQAILWFDQYTLDPVLSELAFGTAESELTGWEIPLEGERTLTLRGIIDRIDVTELANGSLGVVVVDYKSSARSLDKRKLQSGLQLQLPAYLAFLVRHNHWLQSHPRLKHLTSVEPIGAFYLGLNPKRQKHSSSKKSTNKDKSFQFSGIFNNDSLRSLDCREGEQRGDQIKYAINKDGSFSKRGHEGVSAQALETFLETVTSKLQDFGQLIYQGTIHANPYREGSTTACDYCDFKPLCRFHPTRHAFRPLMPSNQPEGKS